MTAAIPGVGVALCTFEGARYVSAQVKSIVTQDPPPIEVVLGDDGSTDRTVDLVRRGVPDSIPLTVLEPVGRLGVTKNFERTVSALSSPIIALSDQDDVWRPGRLGRLAAVFADESVLLVHTDAVLVGPDGESLGRSLFEDLEISEPELELERSGRGFDALLRRNLATGATVLFRRSLLDIALPFPDEWVHDEWLAVLAAARGGLRVVAEPTIDYRQHGENQIGVGRPSIGHKVSRVLEARRDRNEILARKFETLAQRLDELEVSTATRAAARRKAQFERTRARLPRSRARRLLPVLRLARTGAYATYASRGSADIIRDLLQPA